MQAQFQVQVQRRHARTSGRLISRTRRHWQHQMHGWELVGFLEGVDSNFGQIWSTHNPFNATTK